MESKYFGLRSDENSSELNERELSIPEFDWPDFEVINVEGCLSSSNVLG